MNCVAANVRLRLHVTPAGISTVVIGARNEGQIRQNLGAVGWALTQEQVAKLDEACAMALAYPYWHQRFFAE